MSVAQLEPWLLSEPDIMEIAGRLDDAAAQTLEEDAMLCIRSGARRMVIDCGALTYVTASGVRSLLTLARTMQKKEGSFALCDVPPPVAEMFNAVGLASVIEIYDTQNEAIDAVAG